jgi:hypothetical protein
MMDIDIHEEIIIPDQWSESAGRSSLDLALEKLRADGHTVLGYEHAGPAAWCIKIIPNRGPKPKVIS